ncbi:hypothetical protein [Photorhabdus viridis]|uniref:hypothetical protein n=1 Tax=Photorhabdus viridis TaxID=3163327 RepID=UPI00330791D5
MNIYEINSLVKDLKNFPINNDSAILIDPGDKKVNKITTSKLANNLPSDYKIHFIKKNKNEILNGIDKSISSYLDSDSVGDFLFELKAAFFLFESITGDYNPLVSLRVVTQHYIKEEYPSVSELYHRDAAALTLTKCFYGEGAIYIKNDNVKRDFFSENSIAFKDSDATYNPDDYHIVPDNFWLFLKGEMYKGIDKRNQAVFDFILGENAEFKEYFKGKGLIHKGGRFHKTSKRIVFTISTYKTEYQ